MDSSARAGLRFLGESIDASFFAFHSLSAVAFKIEISLEKRAVIRSKMLGGLGIS